MAEHRRGMVVHINSYVMPISLIIPDFLQLAQIGSILNSSLTFPIYLIDIIMSTNDLEKLFVSLSTTSNFTL